MKNWLGGWVVLSVTTGCPAPAEDGDEGESGSSSPATDDGPAEACVIADANVLTWQWNFNDHIPVGDPAGRAYAEDSLAVLDCEVVDGDDDDATMQLELACTSAGEDVGAMQLSVSPVPIAIVDALAADTPLSLAYRPGNDCPNGCSAVGGWLAVRDASNGELLLGIVDVHRELAPVAALMQPIGVSVEPSACAPVTLFPCEGEGEDGTAQAVDVTVTADTDSIVMHAGDQAQLGPYDVVLDRAHVGDPGACVYDAGDQAALRLMITRRP
jgi:hypothetical protein